MAAVHNGRVAPALMLIARVLRGALLETSFISTVVLYFPLSCEKRLAKKLSNVSPFFIEYCVCLILPSKYHFLISQIVN